MTDYLFPQAIVNHQLSGALELTWQDHTTHRLPHALLRSRCRCGGCEQRARSTGRPAEVSPDIRLDDIRPVGDKGLNLVFSDGHGRGIYPWAYLREIAQEHSVVREAPVSCGIAGSTQVEHA